MARQPQWEPTAPIPPAFEHIEPQTPAPLNSRSDIDRLLRIAGQSPDPDRNPMPSITSNLCDSVCGLCVCSLEADHRGMHVCFCQGEWIHGPDLPPRAEQLRRVPPTVHFETMMWTPPTPISDEAQAVLAHAGRFVMDVIAHTDDGMVEAKWDEYVHFRDAVDAWHATQPPPAPIVIGVDHGDHEVFVHFPDHHITIDVSDPAHPSIKEQ